MEHRVRTHAKRSKGQIQSFFSLSRHSSKAFSSREKEEDIRGKEAPFVYSSSSFPPPLQSAESLPKGKEEREGKRKDFGRALLDKSTGKIVPLASSRKRKEDKKVRQFISNILYVVHPKYYGEERVSADKKVEGETFCVGEFEC